MTRLIPPDVPRKPKGGARKGAGRKPTATEARRPRWGPLYLTAAEREQLRTRSAEREIPEQEAVRTALRCDRLID